MVTKKKYIIQRDDNQLYAVFDRDYTNSIKTWGWSPHKKYATKMSQPPDIFFSDRGIKQFAEIIELGDLTKHWSTLSPQEALVSNRIKLNLIEV